MIKLELKLDEFEDIHDRLEKAGKARSVSVPTRLLSKLLVDYSRMMNKLDRTKGVPYPIKYEEPKRKRKFIRSGH